MKCPKCAQARTVLRQFACSGVEHFRDKLEAYLKYSNEDRIKLKLDGMSPVQYRVHHQAKAS